MNIDYTPILVTLLGSGSVITTIIISLVRRHDKKIECDNKYQKYIDEELKKSTQTNEEILSALENIRENGKAHKQENMLLFRGLLGVMDAIQTGHCNGNISTIQEEMKGYLYENGIR